MNQLEELREALETAADAMHRVAFILKEVESEVAESLAQPMTWEAIKQAKEGLVLEPILGALLASHLLGGSEAVELVFKDVLRQIKDTSGLVA